MKIGSSLTDALKLVLLIGLVVMAFGPSYSFALIRVLYGRKWSDGEAPTALRYYCVYVIVLAMNGTSEAFLHAVANEKQLKHSNGSLLIFSGIYIVLNVLLMHSAGAVGLIAANSLNDYWHRSHAVNLTLLCWRYYYGTMMGSFPVSLLLILKKKQLPGRIIGFYSWDMIFRILYSAVFIRHYFQDSSSFAFNQCLPSGWTVLLFSDTAVRGLSSTKSSVFRTILNRNN